MLEFCCTTSSNNTRLSTSMRTYFPCIQEQDSVKWKMEILWFVVLSPKQHCLWGQRPRKMWLRKVATALKMLVVVHERKRKNKKTNKQKPKHIKLKEGSVKSSLMLKGMSWQIGMDYCKFLQPPSLWFNASLSFCSRYLRLNLFPSYRPCQKQLLLF